MRALRVRRGPRRRPRSYAHLLPPTEPAQLATSTSSFVTVSRSSALRDTGSIAQGSMVGNGCYVPARSLCGRFRLKELMARERFDGLVWLPGDKDAIGFGTREV